MKIQVLITTFILLLSASCQPLNLTEAELQLADDLEIKTSVLSEIKKATKNNFAQLPAIHKETGEVINDKFHIGMHSKSSEDIALKYIRENQKRYRQGGFLIFIYEGANNNKSLAVIKGDSDLDIVRYRRTDGINYGLENEDIVARLAAWDKKYGISVVGCGQDWLQVEFENYPSNPALFAKEVYDFCPDVVDQGVGSVANLTNAIIALNGVWLWWD